MRLPLVSPKAEAAVERRELVAQPGWLRAELAQHRSNLAALAAQARIAAQVAAAQELAGQTATARTAETAVAPSRAAVAAALQTMGLPDQTLPPEQAQMAATVAAAPGTA